MADRILEVEELALQIAPLHQQQTDPVTSLGLDMGLTEPAGPHDMRDAERIGRVGLVALRRQRRAHMAGFEADRWNTFRQQFGVQPR